GPPPADCYLHPAQSGHETTGTVRLPRAAWPPPRRRGGQKPVPSSVVCASLQILGEPSNARAGPILASAAQAGQEAHAFLLRCARTRDIARGARERQIVPARHIPRPRTTRFAPSLAGS